MKNRRIGCIVGPENIRSSLERLTGYQEAIQEAGLPFDETLIVKGDFQYESGYEAAQRLLTIGDPPSAIFAFNDLMAVGALSYALEKGYPVPAGLSVVGFDDVRLAVYANPPITTVMQPKYEIGELATQILLERMKNPETNPRQRMLETRLIIRKSTAPFQN